MPVVRYPYLISKYSTLAKLKTDIRWVDPLFGISIGIMAFYLSERDNARPPGHSFTELCQKRFNKQYNYWIKGEPSIGPAGDKPPGRNWGLW